MRPNKRKHHRHAALLYHICRRRWEGSRLCTHTADRQRSHHSDDACYEEWFDEVVDQDGWIALLNFREHVLADMQGIDLDSYFVLGGELNELGWRTFTPGQLFQRIDDCVEQHWGLLH